MRMRKEIFFIFMLILVLFSCFKKNSQTNVENIVIDSKLIESIRKELKNTKIDTPRKVLLKIFLLDNDKNYEEMRNYIYGINYMGVNSADRIIEGIKNKVAVGNFSYSPKGCIFHSRYVDKLAKKGDWQLITSYILKTDLQKYDSYLNETLNTRKENIIMYELEFTVLGFIKVGDQLKLFYSKDLSDCDIDLKKYGIK